MAGCEGSPEPEKKASENKVPDTTQVVQAPVESPFRKEVTYKAISFTVTSPGRSVDNTFTITPSGYTKVNTPVTEHIVGKVSDVLVDDIDGDDDPELAVLTDPGKDGQVAVFIYSSNGDRSMSAVSFPVISKDDKSLSGHRGHDEYEFVEGSFVRRFPLYVNDSATGRMRQFQYKLKQGEAMKQLVLYKTVEF